MLIGIKVFPYLLNMLKHIYANFLLFFKSIADLVLLILLSYKTKDTEANLTTLLARDKCKMSVLIRGTSVISCARFISERRAYNSFVDILFFCRSDLFGNISKVFSNIHPLNIVGFLILHP
jgi:hypothetical protein